MKMDEGLDTGPMLAAQFGYLPGTLWIIIGAVAVGLGSRIAGDGAALIRSGLWIGGAVLGKREIDLPFIEVGDGVGEHRGALLF